MEGLRPRIHNGDGGPMRPDTFSKRFGQLAYIVPAVGSLPLSKLRPLHVEKRLALTYHGLRHGYGFLLT